MDRDDHTQSPTKFKTALRFGGHIVLDLLNTVAHTDVGSVDQFTDIETVCHWLAESGLPYESASKEPRLVGAIVDLREVVRELIQRRMLGTAANPALLNEYLRATEGHWELVWKREVEEPSRSFVRTGGAIAVVLAPLAEAAAELLTSSDFASVKRCGNPECSMVFFDPSATSRRRWCDMATCGNRMKVAAYRQRRRNER